MLKAESWMFQLAKLVITEQFSVIVFGSKMGGNKIILHLWSLANAIKKGRSRFVLSLFGQGKPEPASLPGGAFKIESTVVFFHKISDEQHPQSAAPLVLRAGG